jgi:diguanylate cyclase (GGDEF)-like protein
MHSADSRMSTRFFVALGALTTMLVAVAILGLVGLRSVDRANEQVFDDNLRTAESTGRLAADLGRAQAVSLEVVSSGAPQDAERLRVRLEQILVPRIDADLSQLLRLHADDPPAELAEIGRIPIAWRSFVRLAKRGTLVPGSPLPSDADRPREATRIEQALNPVIDFVTNRQGIETSAAASAHASAQEVFHRSRDWLIVAAIIALLAAVELLRSGTVLRALVAARAEERRRGKSTGEYIGVLQATENEDEAQALLRRQIERSQDDARAVVLVRNNSDNRLEARTSLAQLEALQEPLADAAPRSCLAVRFARGHSEGVAHDSLAQCELCGRLAGASLCEPLLVGGEVIGSVLVNKAAEPSADECRRIRETVAQAAPVLGNLRNLALAERRAATDALTGLPNHRGVQDTLKRMVAQASRTATPLAVVLIDLDHFKQVNDVHGHDSGDELLAAVGVAFRNVIRESDFVGRYGGEEFLILLPASDRQAAVHVAESVRAAIAAVRISGVEQTITASAGVAVLPQDGGDSVTLFRAADRALYAAKHAGRDRVHVAAEPAAHPALGHTEVAQPETVPEHA